MSERHHSTQDPQPTPDADSTPSAEPAADVDPASEAEHDATLEPLLAAFASQPGPETLERVLEGTREASLPARREAFERVHGQLREGLEEERSARRPGA